MILHERPSDLVCVGQAAHAWVSGQLARRWGNGRFARPEPFEDVCLGATQHDVGMAQWDRRPTLDPATGYPQHFLAMDQRVHLELWTEAPELVITQSPYAALLVSMHGHALFKDKAERPGVQAYLDDQVAYQDGLIKSLHEDPDNARRNQLLVWAVDYLALAALTGWTPATVPAPDHDIHATEPAPLRLTVDPWPFDVPDITLAYDGRVLTEPSRTQHELDARLHTAPWTTVEVTWTPAATG
jgi:hypothetical protein